MSPAFNPRDRPSSCLQAPVSRLHTGHGPPASASVGGHDPPRTTSICLPHSARKPAVLPLAVSVNTACGRPNRLSAVRQSSDYVLAASHGSGSTTGCALSARRTSICRSSLLPLSAGQKRRRGSVHWLARFRDRTGQALLARLRELAVQLRVQADVVQRPSHDSHHDRGHAGTARVAAIGEVAALPRRDRTDDEPDEQDNCSDARCSAPRGPHSSELSRVSAGRPSPRRRLLRASDPAGGFPPLGHVGGHVDDAAAGALLPSA